VSIISGNHSPPLIFKWNHSIFILSYELVSVITEDQTYILSSGAEDGNSNGFTIYKKHSQSLNQSGDLVANVTAGSKTWSACVQLLTKAWQHVAIKWSSNGLHLYINGVIETRDLTVRFFKNNFNVLFTHFWSGKRDPTRKGYKPWYFLDFLGLVYLKKTKNIFDVFRQKKTFPCMNYWLTSRLNKLELSI